MSVLINMEMPQTCFKCKVSRITPSMYAFCFLNEKCYPADETPQSDCPLVPVPPHGDLIDRDAAVEKIWDDMRFPSNLANAQFFVNELREMPTIIPADGKDIKVPTREEEV